MSIPVPVLVATDRPTMLPRYAKNITRYNTAASLVRPQKALLRPTATDLDGADELHSLYNLRPLAAAALVGATVFFVAAAGFAAASAAVPLELAAGTQTSLCLR